MRVFLLFALLISSQIAFSQYTDDYINEIIRVGNSEDLVNEWNLCMDDAEFRYADMISDALLKKSKTNKNFIYRKGVTTFHYKKKYDDALKLFKKTITDISKTYDDESGAETKVPTEALYYYAYCLDVTGKPNEATEYYKKYLDENIGVTNVYTKTASVKIINIEVAEKYKANPKKNIIISLIGDSINTVDPEYAPIISPDGSTIFFTSRRHWKEDVYKEYVEDFTNFSTEDIYVSYKKSPNQWTTPFRLPICKLESNEATVSLSPDERTLYLYLDSKNQGDLYSLDLSKEIPDSIKPIEIKDVNTKFWDSHIVFSDDNTMAILASDRPGGYGGRDLYRLLKLPDGSWSKPFNLGPDINTPYDEDAPFLSIDKKQLFFSSNSDKSMGGFDIFVSYRYDENNWTPPINLGYPINSTRDDIYFTTTADGLLGYLSSNRQNGVGNTDIYEVQFVPKDVKSSFILSGKLQSSGSPMLVKGCTLELSCLNCSDATRKKVIFPRIRDGYFVSGLEPCREYNLEVLSSSKKSLFTEKFETSCTTNIERINKPIIIKE